ncbi:MAG TPA: nucleotide exchange factor GrpE, partial [Verrucomicrobiota bacterium]|nr:nucleotide exchange factor GrpE [Verrucomicrobiota bacterium]
MSETQADNDTAGAASAEDLAARQQQADQAGQLKDQLLRTAAEFENFRKRAAREQQPGYLGMSYYKV